MLAKAGRRKEQTARVLTEVTAARKKAYSRKRPGNLPPAFQQGPKPSLKPVREQQRTEQQ